MKTPKLIFTITFTFAVLFSMTINAQKFAKLDRSPMDAATYPTSYKTSDKLVKVIYSRPQLKGRSLNTLAPSGKVWRTGANEAANIIFYKDMNFGGKPVKAGTYALFTIPGDNQWTIILNSDINTWGAYSYNKAKDVLRFKASTGKDETSLEAFSIAFGEDKTMYLGWDTLRVSIPITE